MGSSLEDEAIKIAREALLKHSQNGQAAGYIKEKFAEKYGWVKTISVFKDPIQDSIALFLAFHLRIHLRLTQFTYEIDIYRVCRLYRVLG